MSFSKLEQATNVVQPFIMYRSSCCEIDADLIKTVITMALQRRGLWYFKRKGNVTEWNKRISVMFFNDYFWKIMTMDSSISVHHKFE